MELLKRTPSAPSSRLNLLPLFVIFFVAIDLRPGIVSIGPVLGFIREEFRLSHAMAALLTAIPDVLMGLLALPAPALARRLGRDTTILSALVLLFVSMILRSLSHSPTTLLLSTAGVGAGIAITGSLVAGFIKANFPDHASLVMGLYATALSLGSTAAAAATGPIAVLAHDDWRFATGFWSCLGIVGLSAWGVMIYQERRRNKNTRADAADAHPLPLRNKTAWAIALFFAISNFLFYSIVAWTAPMFQERGFTPTRAGLLLASFTFVFTLGNPFFGAMSKSHDRRGWLATSVAITLIGLLALAFEPRLAPFACLPFAAFGLGGTFTLSMTLPLDNTTSVEEANTWNGFVLTVGYLIAASGPITVGWLRDFSGSFRSPLWFLAGLAALMLALTPFLRPHSHNPRGIPSRATHNANV